MSAATALPARAAEGPWTGTGTLLRAALRRDRRRLTVWIVGLGLLPVYAAVGLRTVYPTTADRLARAAVVDTPAGVLFSGPGYGTDAATGYPLGAMLANELTLTLVVLAAVMSIQLVVRATRAQEEDGTAELLGAAAVGRRAPLAAAVGVAASACAAVTVVTATGLTATRLAAADSLALALGTGLAGLVFAAVAAVTAQLTRHARTATGLALATLAVAAVLRGAGDALGTHGSPLSWVSPIAWVQQTRAFVDLRVWPLLLLPALAAALLALAARLAAGRDLGAGLLPTRPGRATASRLLAGPGGLAARLQRGALTGWAATLLLLGAVFGSLARTVADMLAGNDVLARAVGATGGRAPTDAFLASSALYLSLAVTGAAVGGVLRLRAEETSGRAELLLSAPVGRRRWLAGGLLVSAGASALLLAVAGLGTGVAAAVALGEPGRVGSQLAAQLAYLPAVLVVAGVAAVLVGLAPRATALAWTVVAWVVLVAYLGRLLGLPGWVLRLTPADWVPALPAEPLAAAPLAGLTAVAAVLAASALAGAARRDVPA